MKGDEMRGTCNMHGGDEKCIQNFRWRPDGKISLRRPGCRWKDNIKIGFTEMAWWCGLDSYGLGKDLRQAFVNTGMNHFFTNWATVRFSRRTRPHTVC